MRKPIIILSVALAVVIGILIGYVVIPKVHQPQYVFPPPPSVPSEEASPRPQTKILAEDSFILAVHYPMPEEEAKKFEEWAEEADKYGEKWLEYEELPFNRFGWYCNRFYLQEGENIELVMRSNVPMAIAEVERDVWNSVMLLHIERGRSGSHYDMPSKLETVNGNWKLSFTFEGKRDGNYCLWITNDRADQIWCQYAVILQT